MAEREVVAIFELTLDRAEALQRATLDAVDAHIVVIDLRGQICLVNRSWLEFAEAAGAERPAIDVGANYLEPLRRARDDRDLDAGIALSRLEAVLTGEQPAARHEYPCEIPGQGERWFVMRVTPLVMEGRLKGAVVIHLDITERREAERALAEISSELRQRSKEAECLGQVTMRLHRAASLEESLAAVAEQLPCGFQYPEGAQVRITYREASFTGPSGEPSRPYYRVPLGSGEEAMGELALGWREAPGAEPPPFLDEEQHLLKRVGQLLSQYLQREEIQRELRQAREAQERETRRLNALLEAAADAILTVDEQGTIRQLNPAAEAMLGYSAAELLGTRINRLMPEAHARRHDGYIAGCKPNGGAQVIDANREVEVVHADGRHFPVSLSVSDTGLADPRLFVVILHDLTRRKEAEQERLHYHANFNALTGLPNRHYTLQLLEDALRRGERKGLTLALVTIELPQIERITQGYGQETGDRLLQRAVDSLHKRLGNRTYFLGIGGRGRFWLILEGLGDPGQRLRALVQELLEALEADLAQLGLDLRVSARAGVALADDDQTEAAELAGQAEAALRQAIQADGPRFAFAEAEANERIRDQLALEADLDHALERRELFLVYQPQVALASGRIIGAEALLRWQHPERGVVSPGQFIPLLEESGLIDEVGAWLLEEALRQGQAWAQAGWPLRLAVNLSPRQFRSGALLQQIDAALLRTGFPGERLELEITEGLLLEDRGEIHDTLQALRQRGIELALDDFGTGYSALSYLQSFPLQTLKIDRAFVAGIGERPSAEELLRGILGLGYGLRMEIVAEGIENETQAAFLRELGCPRGQGFGLMRPMSAAALTEVLAESKGVAPSYSPS